MNALRVLAVARKVFQTLRHDPRTVALMLVAPIMAMLIFGFAFGSETTDVRTIVVNEDDGSLAAALVAQLDREALRIVEMDDAEAARAAVRDGEHTGAIIFAPGFTVRAAQGVGEIELFLDTTNNQLSGVIVREVAEAGQAVAAERGLAPPVAPRVEYAHPAAKDARFIDYFVPGVMAFAATLFTTLLTLLAFVGERTSGTLDRLRVTPVTEGEIVLGYELAFGLIAAVQGVLLLTIAILVYDVMMLGSLALAALIIVLMAIDAMGIGVLISAAAHREGQAIQMIPFIVLPVFLLSGIFVPIESLPGWLQPFSFALPPTWAIEGLRDVMLRGWGLERVRLHVAVLAGFAVLLTTLAIAGLRRARRA